MSFYDQLTELTREERGYLLAAPAIRETLSGTVALQRYLAFLGQAYHHVRHTSPLLMAVGSRLGPEQAWLQREVAHYIAEELGHEEWILSDIAAAGGDAELVRASEPHLATDTMVAYAWDTVMRRNPVGFFGMVFVLEGTSIALATQAAGIIRGALGLPRKAFTYLTSHGSLDLEHIEQLKNILDRLTSAQDQEAVIRCARAMFVLYGNVFRALDDAHVQVPVIRRAVA